MTPGIGCVVNGSTPRMHRTAVPAFDGRARARISFPKAKRCALAISSKPRPENTMIFDQKPRLLGYVLASLTYIFGPLLPVLQFEFGASTHPHVNAVWDVLYGIGYSIGYEIFHELVLSRPVGILGFLIWPVLLFYTVAKTSTRLARAHISSKVKICMLLVFFSTFAFNVSSAVFNNSEAPCFTRDSFINY
jgi:hypothetical protein